MNFEGHFSLRRLSILFLYALMLIFLNACESSSNLEDGNSSSVLNSEEVLTFSASPWPPDAINYLTDKMGFFEKHGVNAEVLLVDGYEELFDEVESGKVDVWTMTLLEAVHYNSETGSNQVVWMQDSSAGADALVKLNDESVQSISDLKGKNVGAEKGTVSEFFLQILLNREGLELSDLNLMDIASEDIPEKLISGEIDAGVCYEPCPNEVVNLGGVIVIDSAKERGLIVDVYLARPEHLEENKDAYLKAFMAISEAQEYFNQNPEESARIMQEVLYLPPEEILESFGGLKIPTLRENKTAFNRSSGFNSLYNLAKLAGQYLRDQGLIEDDFDTDQVINPVLVDSIVE